MLTRQTIDDWFQRCPELVGIYYHPNRPRNMFSEGYAVLYEGKETGEFLTLKGFLSFYRWSKNNP
jgi:hypothetical protein